MISVPDIATVKTAPVWLAEHVRNTREVYEHALLAQEGLLFSAWLNGQRERIDLQRRRRAKQVAWALRGGPLPRRREQEGR
jgi:hypothetical protein